MNANKCEVDITFNIGERGMCKIHVMRDPLWLVERLRIIEGIEGVGIHPDSISLRIKAETPTATMTIAKAQSIINEVLI